MTAPHELIGRIADLLRNEVGPAAPDGAPRAQAYGASAVLRRVARGLELGRAHAEADAGDRRRLHDDLAELLAGTDGAAPDTAAAAAALGGDHGGEYKAALDRLVAALHRDRSRLPAETAERALARVRRALRAVLDRELEVAR